MRLLHSLVLTIASLTFASAALCQNKNLLGIGDSQSTYPPGFTFAIYARSTNGSLLPLTYSPTAGAMAPLTLGAPGAAPPLQTRYELSNGTVRTQAQPYRYLSTRSPVNLVQGDMFAALDGNGVKAVLTANNVTCGQEGARNAIRWSVLSRTGLSTGSGAVFGTFGMGSKVSSPTLSPLLPIDAVKAVDLITIFI